MLSVLVQPTSEANAAFEAVRLAITSGNRDRVLAQFAKADDAKYLWDAAVRRGGLRSFRVNVIPAPPGWTKWGDYWAIVWTRQDIEEDRDIVFPLVRTGSGLRLGKEIPEWERSGWRIKHQKAGADFAADENRVTISTEFELEKGSGSLVMRLGSPFNLKAVKDGGKPVSFQQAGETTIPNPAPGSVVKAGSLVVMYGEPSTTRLTFDYQGTVNTPNEDKITPEATYLTAWWLPSIARLPHTTEISATGPSDWEIRSEGIPVGAPTVTGSRKTVSYRCDLPISYPKIVAGRYKLAAELKQDGKTFRAWHLGTVDKARGEADVKKMADGCRFFEQNLVPYPFPSYECFDADTYYGIESYSYTLLNRGVTTRFVTHELGHTWFGGIAPCTYVRDTWNEGVTQYADSVLYSRNADGTLQQALRGLNLAVPLSKMDVAHGYGGQTYYRGAYVMRMLENEIGLDKVLAGLRAVLKDRVGKDTVWADLRPYFEKESTVALDWFWNQWVDGTVFPRLEIAKVDTIQRDQRYSAFVRVDQKGTTNFRLRFAIRIAGKPSDTPVEKVVVLANESEEFQVDVPFVPKEASLVLLGYTLGTAGGPVAFP